MKLSILMSCCLLLSCTASREFAGSKVTVEYADAPAKVSEFADEPLFVLPDNTVGESLFSDVSRIVSLGDRYYILDRKANKVLAFDAEGHFLSSTSRYKGKANGEYIRIHDVSVDCRDSAIWVSCDAPYQFMLFDKDLNLKRVMQAKHLVKEFAIEGDFAYIIVQDEKEWNHYELVCYDKGSMEHPIKILDYDRAIPSAGGLGKSMTGYVDRVVLSMPFDNTIYELSCGEIINSWNIEMREWFSWEDAKSTHGRQFYKAARDKKWFIQNVVMSGEACFFNTNGAEVCMMDGEGGCVSYRELLYDDFALSSTWLTAVGGKDGYAAQIVPVTMLIKLKEVLATDEGVRNKLSPEAREAVMRSDEMSNPLIIIRKFVVGSSTQGRSNNFHSP